MAVVTDTPSRRERERLARRAEMLAAARTVFAEKGFEQATLEEVADLAEFGKGTLYNYFPGGKDEILFAVLDDLFGEMADLIRQHFAEAPSPPTVEAFRDMIARIITHYTSERGSFLLLMNEAQRLALSSDPAIADILREHRNRAMSELEAAVASAVAAGYFKPLAPLSIAHVLMGNIKGYLGYALSAEACSEPAEPRLAPEAAAAFISEILFEGLRMPPTSAADSASSSA